MNDDDLRTRLREADPAHDLTALPAMRRDALLERAADGPARPPARPFLALGALAAAGAVAVAAVALIPRPIDGPTGPVVALHASGTDPMTMCAALPDFAVDALRRTDLAFSARVTGTTGDTVELVPIDVYRGPATGLVRLSTDAAGGPALDGPVLEQGERVLVASVDGEVQGCGLSAAESPELLRYYEEAFGS